MASNKGKPTRFIRKNGKVIPIYGKDSASKMPRLGKNMSKRKGARYDKESGYHLDKRQRLETKASEAYNSKLLKKTQDRSKKFGDLGATIGVGIGTFFGGLHGKGVLKKGVIGLGAGFAAGRIYGALTGKLDKKGAQKAYDKVKKKGLSSGSTGV